MKKEGGHHPHKDAPSVKRTPSNKLVVESNELFKIELFFNFKKCHFFLFYIVIVKKILKIAFKKFFINKIYSLSIQD